jgi:hypothetical protein
MPDHWYLAPRMVLDRDYLCCGCEQIMGSSGGQMEGELAFTVQSIHAKLSSWTQVTHWT